MSAHKTALKKLTIYTFGALTGFALSLGVQALAQDNRDQQALPVDSLRTVAEVYGQIKAHYYENKSDADILEGALKGMANLDPHSEYLDTKDYADMRESTRGEFGGLGMEIGSEDGFIKVVAPIEDTPAERAGIRSGDYIIKINDEATRGMSVTDAVKRMRGEPGTKITLTLSRKDEAKPIVVNLTRAIIKVRSVRHHLLENGYGYIRISQFQERTVPALAEAAQALRQANGNAPLKGLILDLRDDPGGLLNGAVGVSAAFLSPNLPVVSTRGRQEAGGMKLNATFADYRLNESSDPLADLPAEYKTIPLVVLINSGSASASEIVAGALQDHRRAVIVGTQSFGKGSVQTVVPLSNGAALKLTTQLYYTPNDRSIQAQGIVPDVEVADPNRRYESREADLSGHIGNPTGGAEVKGQTLDASAPSAASQTPSASETAASEPAAEDNTASSRHIPNPEKDTQLRRALELIKSPQQWQSQLGAAAKRPAPAVRDNKN